MSADALTPLYYLALAVEPDRWSLVRIAYREVAVPGGGGRTRRVFDHAWLRGGERRDVLRDGRHLARLNSVPFLVQEKVAPRDATLPDGARRGRL